jgi:hypothetical protein
MGKDIYPLTTAFPIWIALSRSIPLGQKKFSRDPALKEIYIDERTGQVAPATDQKAISILV